MYLRHLQYVSCVTLQQVKYRTGNHFAKYCRRKILLYYLGGYRKQIFLKRKENPAARAIRFPAIAHPSSSIT
jgi:hypothetical protein